MSVAGHLQTLHPSWTRLAEHVASFLSGKYAAIAGLPEVLPA
jgi:hypothetical protein